MLTYAASGIHTSDFNVLKVSPGSVVVDLNAPETAAQELHRQSLVQNSTLRSGKGTQFTDAIILTRPGGVHSDRPSSPTSLSEWMESPRTFSTNLSNQAENQGLFSDVVGYSEK